MYGAFPGLLKSLRQKSSLSQRQLAQAVQVHHTYISKLESGQERPSQETIQALAKALKADAIDLELAAGHLPEEFARAVAERKELQVLLGLAARNRLKDEDYKALRELIEHAGRVNVPVWLE